MTIRIASVVLLAFLFSTSTAQAQSFELGAHFVGSQWSEFDGSDFGVGGRFTWKPVPVIGIETEWNWYPSDFPGDIVAFSGNRLEGMAALTAGPRLGRVRLFARAAAGFLQSAEAPRPYACVLIFPPPLSCTMAAGQTMPAFELGGGVEVATTATTFVRVDLSDRILKYPGPVIGPADELIADSFFGHAFKFTLGGGWRF